MGACVRYFRRRIDQGNEPYLFPEAPVSRLTAKLTHFPWRPASRLGRRRRLRHASRWQTEERLRSAMCADRLEYLIECQVLLPPVAVIRVIAGARAIQTQESRKAVCTQFTLQYVESVPLELLVGQFVDGDHSPCSLLQDTGFRTGI